MTEETDRKEDESEDAQRVYDEGVRFLEMGEYEKAAEMLAKALEIRAKCVEEKDECMAEWYYRYGSALYYHYKSTAEVLGDRSKKVIETKSLKIEKEEGDGDEEEERENESDGEDESEAAEEEEELEAAEEENELEAAEGENDLEAAEAENDLEIAWNVLEMARLIYSENKEKKMELSEVHILLGEIALEEEKLDLAQSEIEKALELRLGLGDRRALAHAHFMLSLVLEWKQDDQAVVNELEKSKSLLLEEMENSDQDRVEEIKQTIEQIENKIQTVKDTFVPAPEDEEEYRSKLASTSISDQVRELVSSSSTVATSSTDNRQVHQLAVKKRYVPYESEDIPLTAKKPKHDQEDV